MKIGIHSEPNSSEIGGAQCFAAILAETLGGLHQVDFVHHYPLLTTEQLSEFSGTNLSAIRLRSVAAEPNSFGSSHNPWRRYREERAWYTSLSEPYDLFINITHSMPPFCHAPRGVLVILFPYFNRFCSWPWKEGAPADGSRLWKRLRRFYYDWEWKKRLNTYQLKMAISHYTQVWTKHWWGVDCQVVYPPVDNPFRVADKANTILSVGRFSTAGRSKKQLEMVTAFRQMDDARLQGWEYFCVGGLSDLPQDHDYFENVRRMGAECRVQVLANVERSYLKRLYEQAKIFWHAAGYAEDDGARPELAEHFGIVTVEAMAAGCVPIVINKGAQPEIVQHGVSGFLWNTLEELKEYTRLVARDEQLRAQISEAARTRARLFSREEFLKGFLKLSQPLFA